MHILVVEDEHRMRELLRQGLTEDGHAVTVANDGHEGLSIAQGSDPKPPASQTAMAKAEPCTPAMGA